MEWDGSVERRPLSTQHAAAADVGLQRIDARRRQRSISSESTKTFAPTNRPARYTGGPNAWMAATCVCSGDYMNIGRYHCRAVLKVRHLDSYCGSRSVRIE